MALRHTVVFKFTNVSFLKLLEVKRQLNTVQRCECIFLFLIRISQAPRINYQHFKPKLGGEGDHNFIPMPLKDVTPALHLYLSFIYNLIYQSKSLKGF